MDTLFSRFSIKYEPLPRFYHLSQRVGSNVLVQGGRTKDFSEKSRQHLTFVVEIFDAYSEIWEQRQVEGDAPSPGLYLSASTSLHDDFFTFGGLVDKNYFNTLHRLDTKTWRWCQLSAQNAEGAPMPKVACGIISFRDSLGVFGGYGIPQGPTEPRSFIKNTRFKDGRGWTNEFHIYHLKEGVWSCPTTTGERPPPCSLFTFTAIDNRRAVLFGGKNEEQGRMNNVYIIDLRTMHWTKLNKSQGGPWPEGRSGHAAVCLNYGQQYPQLMVSGGLDRQSKPLADIRILDVERGRWWKVSTTLKPRYCHSLTAFSLGHGLTELTMFGGTAEPYTGSDETQPKLADTNLLQFGLVENCGQPEWKLLSVINNTQRGLQERIVEKLQYTLDYKLPAVEEARQAALELARQAKRERDRARVEKWDAEGERDRARVEKQDAEGERDRARLEKREAEKERDRVKMEKWGVEKERDRARVEKWDAEGERDRARMQKQEAVVDRDRARVEKREADREKERARMEKQEAESVRDRAKMEKLEAERERDRARMEKREAEGERDRARVEKQEAESERDRARVEKWSAESERDRATVEKWEAEGERNRMRVELQQAQERIDELQQRLDEFEKSEHERLVVQEQAITAEQRGPSWEVMEEDLLSTEEVIGIGGWAEVRVAHLKVAAKYLHRQLAYDYHHQVFQREMAVAARVSHPNLLRFLGARLEGGMAILTELMPTSLRTLLDRGHANREHRLSREHIISIAIDVACALNYLHNMTPDPIIHRDLSSANVLLQPTHNEGWLAKVSDFGTASFQQKLRTENPGSPVYAAPESHNPALQSPKMDIYSFGVLLVEMCTCEFPTPECRDALIESIEYPQLLNLITQCLNEDTEHRPTAAQLVDLLRAMQ